MISLSSSPIPLPLLGCYRRRRRHGRSCDKTIEKRLCVAVPVRTAKPRESRRCAMSSLLWSGGGTRPRRRHAPHVGRTRSCPCLGVRKPPTRRCRRRACSASKSKESIQSALLTIQWLRRCVVCQPQTCVRWSGSGTLGGDGFNHVASAHERLHFLEGSGRTSSTDAGGTAHFVRRKRHEICAKEAKSTVECAHLALRQ